MKKVLPHGSVIYSPEHNLFADFVEDGAAATITGLRTEIAQLRASLTRSREENERLKGECICGHDGKLTSADCPRHGTVELSLADHAKRAKNLIAEVERLTKENGEIHDRMIANAEEAGLQVAVLQSSLTRSKAEGRLEGMEDLVCYMIDNCERDIITEEYLQSVLADYIRFFDIAAAIRQQAVQPKEGE